MPDKMFKKLAEKETYTPEEKRYIMNMLNVKRLINEKMNDKFNRTRKYTQAEKNDILKELNKRRINTEKMKRAAEKRIGNKKIYIFKNKKFYKLAEMDQEYYMSLETYEKLTSHRKIVSLYYKIFGELRKKDFLVKVESYSDKIFISNDILRVHYRQYRFEDA